MSENFPTQTVSYRRYLEDLGAILDWLHDNNYDVIESLIISLVFLGWDPRWDLEEMKEEEQANEG